MKSIKKILLLILALSLSLMLFACGGGSDACTEHTDADGNNKCDACGETITPGGGVEKPVEDLPLVENGQALFQIVVADSALDLDGVISAANSISNTLGRNGITVSRWAYEDDTAAECEVIIGVTSSRGEDYYIDDKALGIEGYSIQIIGKKVVIVGGSGASTVEAIQLFLDMITSSEDAENFVMTAAMTKEVVQDNYDITAVKVNGTEITDYVIVIDSENIAHKRSAAKLQTYLYEYAGYWLPIVDETPEDGKAFVFESTGKDSTPEDSFLISASGNTLTIHAEYDNALYVDIVGITYTTPYEDFVTKTFLLGFDEIDFEDEVVKQNVSVVYYSDFGAKGDGKTDDFAALYFAHEYANVSGQSVKAFKDGESKTHKSFYIEEPIVPGSSYIKTISIKTNTDWTGASFIIDDTELAAFKGPAYYKSSIFTVESYYEKITIDGNSDLVKNIIAEQGPIGRDTTKLDLGLGYPAMLIITNKNHRVYVRYGPNANSGDLQEEIVLVDAEGNISEETPIFLDYKEVTSISVIRDDIEPLTIKGGTVTTYASRQDITYVNSRGESVKSSTYFFRGLCVNRSHTLITGMAHYSKNEFTVEEQAAGLDGPPYKGFYWAEEGNDIIFDNCIVSARRYFAPGTYGISAHMSNNVVFRNCTQSNYYKADGKTISCTKSSVTGELEYWGVGGSSFCKNMIFDGSMLTRFDAHAGLYSGKIINSQVSMINLVGGGTMEIINSRIDMATSHLIGLRMDYGSTWRGDIIIKDCTMYLEEDSDVYVMTEKWNNHDFGYGCYMPNVTIDNLTYEKGSAKVKKFYYTSKSTNYGSGTSDPHHSILSEPNLHLGILSDGVTENKNPLGPPEYFKVVNNTEGFVFTIQMSRILDNTRFEIDDKYAIYDYSQHPDKK